MSKLVCFGGLSCPRCYKCRYTRKCRKALFAELALVPLEVVSVVTAFRIRMKLLEGVPESVIAIAEEQLRVKAFGWERRVKVGRTKK